MGSRFLIIAGLIISAAGGVLWLIEKTGIKRIPGDISVQRDTFTFYFPLGTSIVLSIVLTILFNLFSKK